MKSAAIVSVFGGFIPIGAVLLTVVFAQMVHAESLVEVSSLLGLRDAVQESNQTIVMKPGRYNLEDLPSGSRKIACVGSNNRIKLVGVYVSVPVGTTQRSYITISGDNNVVQGGTFEDIYKNGVDEISDFSAYNQDRSTLAKGLNGSAVMSVSGHDNTVADTKLTIRGSFPYGYGSIYGIGAENAFGLDKRCGILVTGQRNTIDGCEIQQRAFGHGIYMQRPADKTIIKNTLVEGAMRPSNELYLETDPRALPVRSNYQIPDSRSRGRRRGRGRSRNRDRDRDRDRDRRDSENRSSNRPEIQGESSGTPIPKDTMIPLSEDGIRVYTRGGSVTVENCIVKKMRGGIRLYLASEATVINSTAIDCGQTNFNLPDDGQITGSTGNFAFAPISDFRLSKSGQEIELTIVPSPHAVGPHNVADVLGNNHRIVFHRSGGPPDTDLRPIVVSGSGSLIRNETEYPVILQASASGNTVISSGLVTDHGENNKVSQVPQLDGAASAFGSDP